MSKVAVLTLVCAMGMTSLTACGEKKKKETSKPQTNQSQGVDPGKKKENTQKNETQKKETVKKEENSLRIKEAFLREGIYAYR